MCGVVYIKIDQRKKYIFKPSETNSVWIWGFLCEIFILCIVTTNFDTTISTDEVLVVL